MADVHSRPRIALIAAMAANRVIGQGNKMPWHLPADLKHFKRLTLGKPIVMGRKTFESIGSKPLPGRVNIVISSRHDFQPTGVVVAPDLRKALEIAEGHAVDEIMVIGGASVYEQALPLADRLYLTFIQLNVPGDAQFPDLRQFKWNEVSSESHTPDAENPYNYSFVTFERAADIQRTVNEEPAKTDWRLIEH